MDIQEARQPYFKRILQQLPIVFPLVALFHLVLLALALFTWREVLSEGNIYWTIAGMLVYTALWFAVCDLKKWAGTAYILFTALCIAIQFLWKSQPFWQDVAGYYFPVNALFCFFILFYYKRLR